MTAEGSFFPNISPKLTHSVFYVSLRVRLRALSRSHYLIDFHENWHRRKNPQK